MSRASTPKSKKPTMDSHEFFLNEALNIPENWGIMDRREAVGKILELAKTFIAEVMKTPVGEDHELFHVASLLYVLCVFVGLAETEMLDLGFGDLGNKLLREINESRSRKKAYDMPEVFQLMEDFVERGTNNDF